MEITELKTEKLFNKNKGTFFVIGGILLALIIIGVFLANKKSIPASTPADAKAVVSDEPLVGWLTTSVSEIADSDTTKPKHGTFVISFGIMAGSKADLYFSPTCTSSTSKSGVTFTVFKNGAPLSNPGLSTESCTVLSYDNGNEKTASGRYHIRAGTQGVFQLIVVDHPEVSGTYQVGITGVGYAITDKPGTTLITIDPGTVAKLKTEPLTL